MTEDMSAEVELYCAVYGVGSVFPVQIARDAKVSALQKAIFDEKRYHERYSFDASALTLYLAKKNGAWLKDDDSVDELLRGKIDTAYKKMRPSWKLNDDEYFGADFQPGDKEIHVLLGLPEAASSPSVPVAVPKGPEVDLSSCDDLLAFLEGDMTSKEAILSKPHILVAESLQFRLVGREMAIDTAAQCFRNIIAMESDSSDRTERKIPVCSGISGLGKTRMLEEGGMILREVLKLDPKHIVSVIVPYFNGFSPQPIEQLMPIEASFSWRLLYRFFLEKNCAHSFPDWFKLQLPRNGGQLKFASAVQVIERKLRVKVQEPATLYLFLGIDEYQKIERVGAQPKIPKMSVLHELVEVIGDILCRESSMVLLPMFAGTDWGVIESKSIANSSFYVTKRLPMALLTMKQVFKIVENSQGYARLLKYSQICRDLFLFSGVPRWIVDYLRSLKTACGQAEIVSMDKIKKCFMETWTTYVESFLNVLETRNLVRLAAYAVSGRPVSPNDIFDGNCKWSRLRDSSICLLVPRTDGQYDVQVPYALMQSIGLRHKEIKATKTEREFASSLKDLNDLVDSNLFDCQPWQSWEIFGACFYAVRINALLVLGQLTATLGELLHGTMMTDKTRKISVKLVASRVFQCSEKFGASTPQYISQRCNPLETTDWISEGRVVVNGDGGAGVDIFFALNDAAVDQVVVFVDQRKRQFGKFQPSRAKDYFEKLSVCPDFLKASDGRLGARLVRGVMNCVSPSNLATYVVPPDCFLMSRDETEQFHGALAYHPACSPIISINSACKTALTTLFEGNKKEVDRVVEEILKKRTEPSGGFSSFEELYSFIKAKRLKVELPNSQFAEFSY